MGFRAARIAATTFDAFAPDAKVIHADIDPAEISKNRVADIPIVGDLRQTLQGLLPKVKEEMQRNPRDISGWKHHLDYICERYPLAYDEPDDGLLPAQYVVKRIGEMVGKDAIYCTGVGPVSYTHLTLPTKPMMCRSRWSPYH